MKTIRVVAAVICDNLKDKKKIFATARGYGEFKGGWEFPGGKIEPGETSQEALVREISEELDTKIVVGDLICTVEYDYPAFHLSMDCFWAQVAEGNLVLKEAEAAKWLTKDTLGSVDWLPADLSLIDKIKEQMKEEKMTEIIKLNDHTWRIEDGFVRFFLLEGSEKALLLDTGAQTPNAKGIVEGLTKLPVILMNTHADPDHISGNCAFEKVYMHPEEAGNYKAHGGECEIVPVGDGDEIDLGGRVLKIIAAPGHTPGSICVLDKDARVLYSGDTVQDSDIFMFGPMRNMTAFIETQAKLDAMKGEFDQVYPCHGTPVLGNDAPAAIKAAAETVAAGNAQSVPVEMFGRPVALYKFPCCGFFCDK